MASNTQTPQKNWIALRAYWAGFVLVAASVFITPLLMYFFNYHEGATLARHDMISLIDFYFLPIWIILVVPTMVLAFIIAGLVNAIISLYRKCYRVFWIRSLILLGMAFVVVFAIWWVSKGEPGYVPLTKGLAQKVNNDVDIEAIEKWLDETGYTLPAKLDNSNDTRWPDAIRKHEPGYINFINRQDGVRYVRLTWGGIAGHYGLIVGADGGDVPLDEYYDSEYRIIISPKAFVWHQIKLASTREELD